MANISAKNQDAAIKNSNLLGVFQTQKFLLRIKIASLWSKCVNRPLQNSEKIWGNIQEVNVRIHSTINRSAEKLHKLKVANFV